MHNHNLCSGCGLPIYDRYLYNVAEKVWHASCLMCVDCRKPLSDKCFARDGTLYCRDDFFRRFFTAQCADCGQLIGYHEKFRQANNKVYHVECFKCSCCGTVLDTGDKLYVIDGCKLLCKYDYDSCSRIAVPSIPITPASGGGALSDCNSDDVDDELNDVIDDFKGDDTSSIASPSALKGSLDDVTSHHDDEDSPPGAGGSCLPSGGSGGKRRGPRTTIKAKQLETLKSAFNQTPKPTRHIREQLARETGLNMRVIQSIIITMTACPSNGTENRTVNLQFQQFKHITDVYVLPAEMIIGFVLQLISLKVLYGKKISGLAYTFYLKALSVNYLMNIAMLVPAILRKTGHVNQSLYWVVFYHAHLEKYLVNVFLLSGNLIIVALGVEPLRAIWRPLQSFVSSPIQSRVCVSVLYIVATVTIIPVAIYHTVETNKATGLYCTGVTKSSIVKEFVMICPALLECGIVLTVLVVYCMLFLKHKCMLHNPAFDGANSRRCSNAGRRRHRLYKTTSLCLGSITGFLVANLPSAGLELMNLLASTTPRLASLMKDNARDFSIWQLVANICLISNFTVTFIMQCLFSAQYRTQVLKQFGCVSDVSNQASIFNHNDNQNSSREPGRHQRPVDIPTDENRKLSSNNIANGISAPTKAAMLTIQADYPYGSCSSQLSPKNNRRIHSEESKL